MKQISQEVMEQIQEIMIEHNKIKLIIYPKKVEYDNGMDYGDNVYTVKLKAIIPECSYKEDDIPYLNMLINVKSFINKSKNPYESIQLLCDLYNKNKKEFKITITPYPDDISADRIEVIEKFISKIGK